MATLVWPLASGFSDAPSGTAEFYRRGTSTLSSLVYSDPDGQTAAANPSPLNSSGRVNRYVTERVDLVVKTAAGVVVATINDVVSVDGRTVRLESDLFTGSNPNGNGQTVASGITTLNAALSLLRESFGADDGYILPTSQQDSTEYLLKNALAGVLRDARFTSTALGATTTYTPDSDYGIHYVSITGASLAFNDPTGTYTPRTGAPLIIFFRNLAGANRTPTWGSAYSGIPATAVATSNTALYMFMFTGGSVSPILEWVSITGDPIEAAA